MKKRIVNGWFVALILISTGGVLSALTTIKGEGEVIGWHDGKTPIAPEGFTVTRFADDFNDPKLIYVAPSGDIFISESATSKLDKKQHEAFKDQSQSMSAVNKIIMFRDTNGDGVYDGRYVYKNRLNEMLGMQVVDNYFYVINKDGIVRFAYDSEATCLAGEGEEVKTIPGVDLSWYTASSGSVVYKGNKFPEHYQNGMFSLSDYRVLFTPFVSGVPTGSPEDFLTGFIASEKKGAVHGHPVSVAVTPGGALLVSDDASKCIWKVQGVKN